MDNGRTKTIDELVGLAKRFCHDDRSYRSHVHMRPGELAATDGRILFHATDKAIAPEGYGETLREDPVLDFTVGPEKVVAVRAQLEMLAAMLIPAWHSAREDMLKAREAFDRDMRTIVEQEGSIIRRCPCCGEEFVDDCGDLTSLEAWAEENRPGDSDIKGVVWLGCPGLDAPIPVSLRYLGMALSAARELGGADSISTCVCGTPTVILRGDGWFIVIVALRPQWIDKNDPVVRVNFEKED